MAYPTLAECKAYMGVTVAGEDTRIQQMLDGTIEIVEQYTNRVFVAAAKTRYYGSAMPAVTQQRRVLSFFEDLVSVTSITNGDGTVLAVTDYDLVPNDGPPYHQLVIRNASGERFLVGGDGTPITLVGSFGYSAACPDDVFLAILELVHLSHAAQMDGSGVTMSAKGTLIDKGKWPPRVLRVLDLRRR